jgi:hypothetical protein
MEIKKRPDLTEVVKSLRASGRDDVADKISDLLTPVPNHNVRVKKPGKFKYAYLFVNNSNASMDDQSKMIFGFIRALERTHPATKPMFAESELVPVTLPRGLVVLALRVVMEAYVSSVIPKILEKHAFMQVYLRKPRSDTQHLAQRRTEESASSNTTDLQHTKAKE